MRLSLTLKTLFARRVVSSSGDFHFEESEIENRKWKHVVYLSSESTSAKQQFKGAVSDAGMGMIAVNVSAKINDEIVHLGNYS